VLEGPTQLLDWGVKVPSGDKNTQCLNAVRELIGRYRPHFLVLENTAGKSSRRSARVRELLEAIRQAAQAKGVKVLDVTPDRVKRAFIPRKDMVAAAIAGRFPELAPRLPRSRTLTMNEQYKMPIFDAMAFALTFFYFRERKRLFEERKAIRSALH
jgi:hypothetical protein